MAATSSGPLGFIDWVRLALGVAGVLIFFTTLDSYAFAAGFGPPPVLWVFAFAGAAAVLVIVEPRRPLTGLRSPLHAWIFFFFLLTTIWALWMRNAPDVIQELRDRYRSILFLLTFAVIFDDPRVRRASALSVAACVALAALINVAELLSIIRFAEVPGTEHVIGRAAGLYLNPNGSGMAIAYGLVVAVPVVPKAWRFPLLVAAFAGVVATFSRGAAICLALAVLWLSWLRVIGRSSLLLYSVLATLLFVYAVPYLQGHEILNSNTLSRLQWTKDDSGRTDLALRAWEVFSSSPFLGHGLGATRAWETLARAHNIFLTLAADHGLLGLLAFPALCLSLIAANRSATGFALVLMVAGIFSHNLLDDRSTLLLIAFVAGGHGLAPKEAAETAPLQEIRVMGEPR